MAMQELSDPVGEFDDWEQPKILGTSDLPETSSEQDIDEARSLLRAKVSLFEVSQGLVVSGAVCTGLIAYALDQDPPFSVNWTGTAIGDVQFFDPLPGGILLNGTITGGVYVYEPIAGQFRIDGSCLLYTSPSPRDRG